MIESLFSEMCSLAQYLLSEITEIVSELLFSWEKCDDNIQVCGLGIVFFYFCKNFLALVKLYCLRWAYQRSCSNH